MFAPTNHHDSMAELQRKRAREEEEQMGNGSTGFCEHRNKRIQCLPLRTSPKKSNQWPPSSSITPLNSDSDESLRRFQANPWSNSQAQAQYGYSDLNMMEVSHLAQMQQPQTDCGNGRLPTPMQPTFAAQVRGQHGEWAGPGPAVKSMNGVVNMGHHHTGVEEDPFVPRTMAQEADWQSVQNHRRLPSPISEGDDCMNQHMDSPGMMLDNSFQSQLSIHHETSEPSPQPSPTQAMVHPNAMMDIETHQSEDPEDPTTPSPRGRGHIRSRHTVNNWTWQPGMKKSFSIGYRSDCEKCRLKVPGHFNHIVIS